MSGEGRPGRGARRVFRVTRVRPDPGRDLDAELEHHFVRTIEALMAGGWTEEEARMEAERRFGDRRRYRKELSRIDRRRVAMDRWAGWAGTVRSGAANVVRGIRRRPGFAAAVVLTLGLGIGANAAIFAIVDRLLLSPPAGVERPEEIRRVMLQRRFIDRIVRSETLTYPDFVDLKGQPEFAAAGAWSGPRETTVGRGDGAHRARVAWGSWELFTMLGVSASRGRFFGEEADAIGAPGTAVLGYDYWRSRTGSDPSVLGSTVTVDGFDYEVIGIAPEDFTGMDLTRVDVWLPLRLFDLVSPGEDWADPVRGRGWWWLSVGVRMAEGASVGAAQERASRVHLAAREDRVERGEYDAEARILLTPVLADRGPEATDVSRVALWLAGVSLLVLLIACANVANLLLAREAGRRRETAVRLVLGISRGRLVGERVVESLGLALLGGGVAAALAWWGGAGLRRFLLPDVVFDGDIPLRMLVFVAGVSLAAGVLAGIGPALQSGRTDLQPDLKEGARGATAGGSRLRRALTVAQAGLSAILLVGAGLFVQSLQRIESLDLGIAADDLVMVTLELDGLPAEGDGEGGATEGPSPRTSAIRALHREAAWRIAGLDGVAGVAWTDTPLGWARATDVRIPGIDSLPPLPGGGPYHQFVSPGFLETLGVRIVRGRGLDERDASGAEPVVVVNESLARIGWPGGDPLQGCLVMGEQEDAPCRRVVGVAENASRGNLQEEEYGLYYLPMAQSDDAAPTGLYVRARDAVAVAAAVASALRGFDPRVRFVHARTVSDWYGPQMRSWRLGASMFSVFGVLALAVAAVGLYSLLAFDVALRRRELGIRTALGAERGRLRRMVLGQGSRLAVLGVAAGLLVSALAGNHLADLLFEVSPREPRIYGAVALALLTVALLASWIPAARATRVDPVEALRNE